MRLNTGISRAGGTDTFRIYMYGISAGLILGMPSKIKIRGNSTKAKVNRHE